jgi:hypothetical protein
MADREMGFDLRTVRYVKRHQFVEWNDDTEPPNLRPKIAKSRSPSRWPRWKNSIELRWDRPSDRTSSRTGGNRLPVLQRAP